MQSLAIHAPEHRLEPEAVARQRQAAFRPVPDGEGEHAVQRGQRPRLAPSVPSLDQDLGVRRAAERDAFGLQRPAQVPVVVDFAVVGDREAARGRYHGLRARVGQVDDGEAALAERDAGPRVCPDPRSIGSAMREGIVHAGRTGAETGLWMFPMQREPG